MYGDVFRMTTPQCIYCIAYKHMDALQAVTNLKTQLFAGARNRLICVQLPICELRNVHNKQSCFLQSLFQTSFLGWQLARDKVSTLQV